MEYDIYGRQQSHEDVATIRNKQWMDKYISDGKWMEYYKKLWYRPQEMEDDTR